MKNKRPTGLDSLLSIRHKEFEEIKHFHYMTYIAMP